MKKNLLDAIHILKEQLPDLIAIILFGSYGTPYERHESDLDLAILTNDSNDPVKLWNIAQEIAMKINKDVEIIDLQKASTVFCFDILTTGNLIYCSDELKFAKFDNLIMSMYLRFQEERKDILEDIEKGDFYAR